MFEKLIEFVSDAVIKRRPVAFAIDGDHYAVKENGTLGEVIRKPAPIAKPTLEVKTLSGLVDAVVAKIDDFPEKVAVHVVNENLVQLVSLDADEFGRRHVWLSALNQEQVQFPFGKYMVPEDFIIALQNGFLPTDEIVKIQRLASGLTNDSSISTSDDGLSQRVEVKQGVTTRASVELPPRIELLAYRTFREVDPVTGLFLLRLKAEPMKLPTITLLDVDAGKWKYDTMQAIKRHLAKQLPEGTTLIA